MHGYFTRKETPSVETITMTAILTSVGEVFTKAIDWIGDVLATIATEPIALLMVVGLGVVGFSFGLTRRLIRL